jgi:hypothetical protein
LPPCISFLSQQHQEILMRAINRTFALGCTVALFGGCLVSAQSAAPATADPAKPVLQMVQRFENNFMALAQAMPADKYNFAPTSDIFKAGSPAKFDTVRTFGQQITHVTGEAYRLLAPYGVKPDSAVDLKAIDAMTSKDEILKALQASFDYQNKVVSTITPENALTPQGQRGMSLVAALIAILSDDGDHYGQLVEYGRMNGIIPPSTERQMQSQPAAPPK